MVLAAAGQSHARGSIPVLIQVTKNTTGDVFDPRIRSQDGTRIVFGCGIHYRTSEDICVLNAGGTDVTVVIDDPTHHENNVVWG